MLRQHRPNVTVEINGESSGRQGKAENKGVACHCSRLETQ